MKIERTVTYTAEFTIDEIADIEAGLNWTVTQPNELPVDLNKRLVKVLEAVKAARRHAN